MRRDVAWWGAVILSLLTAGFLPAAAGASELIGRRATGVGLQVDAAGRAAVSFRSEGQSGVVVAWGAVNARHPARGQPQVAFRLQLGRRIGPNTCTPYRGPPLEWLVAACTARDGSHWAVQAWQRMLPNYGVAASGDRAAWELWLSHWTWPLPVLEIWTDWSYRRFHHLYGRLTYGGRGVFGFAATRWACRSMPTVATSSWTRTARRTAPGGSARTAFSPTPPAAPSATGSIPTAGTASATASGTARR